MTQGAEIAFTIRKQGVLHQSLLFSAPLPSDAPFLWKSRSNFRSIIFCSTTQRSKPSFWEAKREGKGIVRNGRMAKTLRDAWQSRTRSHQINQKKNHLEHQSGIPCSRIFRGTILHLLWDTDLAKGSSEAISTFCFYQRMANSTPKQK